MKWLVLCIALMPSIALASLSGVDDITPNISATTQEKLDTAVMTYYQDPSIEKVDTVLDILSESEVLRKKTAWAPMIGFLTVVFAANKDHVVQWISRNDYNTYAQDVIISALMHAKLKDMAILFANGEQWKKEEVEEVRAREDNVNLKKLVVSVPGHIDTLWGAFFGSGEPIYVNEIIDVLFVTALPTDSETVVQEGADALTENKKLAEYTLRQYALAHVAVRDIINKRADHEKDPKKKAILERFLEPK